MDSIVRQVQEYTRGRELVVAKLESQLGLLSQQEQELKQRIESLRNVPLPAAELFAQMISRDEKRSARRDYFLFLLGVLVSAGVGIILKRLGWA
jgi:cell division protein FtsB